MVFTFAIYQIGFITYKLITTTKENPKTEEKVKKKPKTKKNLSEYENILREDLENLIYILIWLIKFFIYQEI